MTQLRDRNGRVLNTHGYGGYSRGCRCGVCRKAKADYMRDRRAAARALANRHSDTSGYHFVPGIKHGYYGYEEAGCRCPVCVSAAYVNRRKRTGMAVGGDTP